MREERKEFGRVEFKAILTKAPIDTFKGGRDTPIGPGVCKQWSCE